MISKRFVLREKDKNKKVHFSDKDKKYLIKDKDNENKHQSFNVKMTIIEIEKASTQDKIQVVWKEHLTNKNKNNNKSQKRKGRLTSEQACKIIC